MENNKSVTAVEWLVQEMINNGLDYPISEMSKILEQAKEMEKQQIIDAYETSHISMMTSEQYYTETYGKD